MRIAGIRVFLVALVFLAAAAPRAQAQTKPASKAFVIEYYYKAKWGHFDEFLRLFKKNHYPVLVKEKELGRILEVEAVRPVYHGTEDGRWDFRVTITWKDAATANDDFDPSGIVAQLYPDKATFEKEEQRRFELLEAHWDLPVNEASLSN
jgi:hypothetical protein